MKAGRGRSILKRRAAQLSAMTVLAVVAATASPSTVGAVSPDHYGWWFKANQTLLLPEVQPPTVPDGGFYVSNEPTGPAGMTAMRFFSDATGGTLRFTPSGALIHDPALVVACPVSPEKQWSDEKGGQWANRAEANCEAAKVPATRTDTGDYTLEISSGFQVSDGIYEVAILPDPASPAPFEVSFEAPGPETFTPAAPPPTFTAPSSSDFSSDFGSDFDSGSDFGSDFSTEPTTSFDAGPGSVVTTPTTESQPETAAPRQPFQPVATGAPEPVEELSGERLAALAGLVLLGIGMWKLSGMEAPIPHPIGPMAHMDRPRRRTAATAPKAEDPRAGGVGRFVRTRAAEPPSL